MWPFKKAKPIFTDDEEAIIVEAIRSAEKQTSGELRVFVENRCKYVDALDRATQIFANLQMEKTEFRNGVLLYVAVKDKQLAIYADSGIHAAAGAEYWKQSVKQILSVFSEDSVPHGIVASIQAIGEALKTHFPYDKEVDKNELPDEIIFSA